MSDFYIRTEDIANDKLLDLFVESTRDREIIDALKGPKPVVLVGSRGVGKSFLLKMAGSELKSTFAEDRVFPVYVSFTKSSLVQFAQPAQFQYWMLSKLCNAIVRALGREGLLGQAPAHVSILAGEPFQTTQKTTLIEKIEEAFESSWKTPDQSIDVSAVPDTDAFKNAVEDICDVLQIKRMAV